MENKQMYYTEYQGIYYRHFSEKANGQNVGVWRLSDREDDNGNVMTFNSDITPIYECLAKFKEENEKYKQQREFDRKYRL